MPKHYKNTVLRAKIIQELAAQYYEQGNKAKSYRQVWRQHLYKRYPMCYRTFLKYIGMDTAAATDEGDNSALQMRLF